MFWMIFDSNGKYILDTDDRAEMMAYKLAGYSAKGQRK